MARYVHAHFQRSFMPRVDAYTHAHAHFQEFSSESAAAVNAEIERQAARQAKTGT